MNGGNRNRHNAMTFTLSNQINDLTRRLAQCLTEINTVRNELERERVSRGVAYEAGLYQNELLDDVTAEVCAMSDMANAILGNAELMKRATELSARQPADADKYLQYMAREMPRFYEQVQRLAQNIDAMCRRYGQWTQEGRDRLESNDEITDARITVALGPVGEMSIMSESEEEIQWLD